MRYLKYVFPVLFGGYMVYHNRHTLFNYSNFLQLQRLTPQLRYVDEMLSSRRVGSIVMEPFRMSGRLLGAEVCYGEHDFEFRILAGTTSTELNARLLFEFSKRYVGQTVPGAMRGQNGVLMGRRGNDELTTAIFGGPVRTTHDDEKMTMRNYAESGHIFSGGYLDISYVDEVGKTYMILKGGGPNNFASLNQTFGSWLFPNMGKANVKAYRKLLQLPEIDHTVEYITKKESSVI